MSDRQLKLPALLDDLVAAGRWPGSYDEKRRQLSKRYVPGSRVAAVAEGENCLYLRHPGHIRSVATEAAREPPDVPEFWQEFGAVDQIDPDIALILGDFCLGSDAPIVLDYRHTPQPCAFRLAWNVTTDQDGRHRAETSWVTMAESFDQFARLLGLA